MRQKNDQGNDSNDRFAGECVLGPKITNVSFDMYKGSVGWRCHTIQGKLFKV
jgi:hypothetical protein